MLNATLIKLRATVLDPVAWLISRRALRRLVQEPRDIDGVIRATRDYSGRGCYGSIHATQRLPEITALAHLVQGAQPKVVVEIGTCSGGTLFIWVRSNPQLELVVSIDLPGGGFGGGYDQRRVKLYRQFAVDRPHTRMEFLRSDSHAPSSFARLEQILGGRSIDFLYVDGDHTYAGVKKDFEMYSPLVRQHGLIAFHDIVTSGGGHEVCRFWNDIKSDFASEEFVEDRQGNMGIGVLHL